MLGMVAAVLVAKGSVSASCNFVKALAELASMRKLMSGV